MVHGGHAAADGSLEVDKNIWILVLLVEDGPHTSMGLDRDATVLTSECDVFIHEALADCVDIEPGLASHSDIIVAGFDALLVHAVP